MEDTEPHFTDDQLRSIKVPTWIVDGDRDEIIKREDTDHMAALIPGAGELILPQVSHFAHLQDPMQFNEALLHFLSRRDSATTKPRSSSTQLENPGSKAEQ